MPQTISITFQGAARLAARPTRCPLCHHMITVNSTMFQKQHYSEVQAVYQCPNPECDSLFIAYYHFDVHNGPEVPIIDRLEPSLVAIGDFCPTICELSPTFIEVFREASEAKGRGLLQIAGPGFRKAFEFLIKDYAAQKANNEEERAKIHTAFSGNVVRNHITDPRIQSVAERALWLGNDEAHYLRKWSNHDLSDLLVLIELTVKWIEIEDLSSKYEREMKE